eukprot:1323691-Prymnesium_polylepis.1
MHLDCAAGCMEGLLRAERPSAQSGLFPAAAGPEVRHHHAPAARRVKPMPLSNHVLHRVVQRQYFDLHSFAGKCGPLCHVPTGPIHTELPRGYGRAQ